MPEQPAPAPLAPAPAPASVPPVVLPAGTLLGFDFGEKRIGVATGETLLRQAHPLTVVQGERVDARFAAIAKLIAEWRPVGLVVGRPVHMDGTPHELTARCERFANQLHGRFRLPVALAEERLTSADAESRLHEAGHSSRSARQHLDAVAAQLILQGFLDAL